MTNATIHQLYYKDNVMSLDRIEDANNDYVRIIVNEDLENAYIYDFENDIKYGTCLDIKFADIAKFKINKD